MREFVVDEFDWAEQSPDLKLTEQWSKIPITTLLNLVESLPR